MGMLKVIVVQGKRLVIRDFKSSDPYVIVKLGNQVILCSMLLSQLNGLIMVSSFIYSMFKTS